MKSASVEVTTINKSKALSLTDPRTFLDGNATVIEPEAVSPDGVGVSRYSTRPGDILCAGVLSYQAGPCFFGVLFENPVAEGELCQELGLYVTADPGERKEMYGLIKNGHESLVLRRLAIFGYNQNQSISVTLANLQVTATMSKGTNCSVELIVEDLSQLLHS
ncbi:uncharacterized protein LOC144605331 [Rhinoraja longicauda]